MTHWSFHPILDSYAAVALLALGMALLLLVGPNFRELTRSRRAVLIALRLGVILLLTLAMLRPTRVSTTRQQQSATLLVLFDVTRSMTLPSSKSGQSRWQVQLEAMRAIEDDLRELSEHVEIKVYAYDERLKPAGSGRDGVRLPESPDGEQTDLGGPLFEAVQAELGKRLIGIIVLGDGTQTAFDPQVEIQQAAREVVRMDAPLYAVAIGPVGDAAQSRDVVVENLPEQYTVFVKNELPVRGALRVRGYVNQPIPVRLIIEDRNGQQRTVGPVRLTARTDGQQLPVELQFVADTPGQYKITLQADEQPGELVTRNNALTAFVNVLEGGLRVLYLYGDLLGEQQKLRESIGASPDIQMDDVYIDPGRRDQWPVDLAELTAADYDVLILESVDAAALGDANMQAIADAVDRGKGLIMIGGYHSFGPGGFHGTPLADVLPVELGRFERQDFDRPISRDLHLWGELVMLPRRDHPVVQLAADTNLATWESLPRLQGANKISPKPAGLVLAATPDDQPLLIAGQYGGGRVLAAAANSTIRWWRYGRQSEHRRFWRQVILWLASREDLARHDVWVQLDQRRFNPGSPIPFTAGAKAPTGEPLTDVMLQAELVAPDGVRTPLPTSADDEQFTGRVDAIDQAGDYLLEVSASRDGQTLGTARTSFQVLDRDVELSNPAADYDLLARLANQTKEAGGRPLAPEQLPELMDDLKHRRDDLEIEVDTKWTLGDTALDAWLMVLSIVGLLTGEWVLRKKWGLV